MSLVRIAARIALVEALKGRTVVGDRVLDSQIGLLEVGADNSLRTDKDAPWIAVYTDTASTEGRDIAGERQFVQSGETAIYIEAGITAAHSITNPETGEKSVFQGIPATDAAFEFRLDLTMRQVTDVLSDPENEWAEIFRNLTLRVGRVDRARLDSAEGTRVAAHQMRMYVDLVADPVRGQPLKPASPIARFMAKARTIHSSSVSQMLDLMEAQLAGADTQWQATLRRHGITQGEAGAMLILPEEGAEADIGIVEVNASPAVPAQ